MKTIEIRCEGAAKLKLHTLLEFQGNLKTLSEARYQKLKDLMLTLGFCEPVTICEVNGERYLLNGHQRCRALRMMELDGYLIPEIPVSYVNLSDSKDLPKLVLALSSIFGELDKQGLYEFLHEHGISPDYVEQKLSLPTLDVPKFKANYFEDPGVKDEKPKKREAKCPSCGERFKL